MSRLALKLMDVFAAIPGWLLEQQARYNEDRARTSPHTRGRQVSAQVAAKKRDARKKKRQTAKNARRLNRFGKKGKKRKRKPRHRRKAHQ